MKKLKILFIISIMFTFYNSTFAQLEIKTFTDKDSYEYGEPIKLYCKIINNTDTAFSFLAGNSGRCQAEFIFNDFYSYKHTFCLPTSEMLEFNPYSSRIYTWNIDPKRTGLPDKDSIQTIVCTFYFDLKDTIEITAPKYLGGTVSVSFHDSNKTEVEKIRDSLNAKVISSHYVGMDIAEDWQIEGILLDSLINRYNNNPLFKYLVHEVMISYESIKNENYIDYYPLQVGNKWIYEVTKLENVLDSISNFIVTDTISQEIIAEVEMPNKLKYFKLEHSEIAG